MYWICNHQKKRNECCLFDYGMGPPNLYVNERTADSFVYSKLNIQIYIITEFESKLKYTKMETFSFESNCPY